MVACSMPTDELTVAMPASMRACSIERGNQLLDSRLPNPAVERCTAISVSRASKTISRNSSIDVGGEDVVIAGERSSLKSPKRCADLDIKIRCRVPVAISTRRSNASCDSAFSTIVNSESDLASADSKSTFRSNLDFAAL